MPRKKALSEDVEFIEALPGSGEPGPAADAPRPGWVSRFLGRPDGPKRARPSAKKPPAGHPTESEIAGLVAEANLGLTIVSYRDALTDLEQERLVKALDVYAQKSERARLYMYRAVQASAGFGLLTVGLSIALPRLIRHGVLPPQIAPRLLGFCDEYQLAEAAGAVPTREPEMPPGYAPSGSPFQHDGYDAGARMAGVGVS